MNVAFLPVNASFVPSPIAVVFAAQVDLSLMSPALSIVFFNLPNRSNMAAMVDKGGVKTWLAKRELKEILQLPNQQLLKNVILIFNNE